MARTVFKLLFFFIALPGVGFFFYEHFKVEDFFRIEKIEVVLNSPEGLTPGYLKPLAEKVDQSLENFRGQSLAQLDLQQIHQSLLEMNWIQEIRLSREWPHTLRAEIVPQEIRLLYMNKQRSLIPVMADGRFLEPISAKEAPDVTLLEGAHFYLKKELREKAIALLNELPENGALQQKNISEIHFDERDGFWVTLIKDQIQVKLGDEQFALKSARANQVLNYLDSRKFQARVIDANLSQKVLVRLRKDP